MKYSILAAGALALAMFVAAFAAPHFDPQSLAIGSTVELSVQEPDGKFFNVCSAVALDDGKGNHTLATATHCMEGIDAKHPLYAGPQHAMTKFVAKDDGDTTLLSTKVSWPTVVKFTKKVPVVGEAGWKVGFPMGMSKLLRETKLAGLWQLPKDSDKLTGKLTYVWDANIGPGDSGGGFFSKKAEVYCVYSFTRGAPSAFAFGMHVCAPPNFPEKVAGHLYGP